MYNSEIINKTNVIRIPVTNVDNVDMSFALITDRSDFGNKWRKIKMTRDAQNRTYWIDLASLKLEDGTYEYEFILDNNRTVADPFAEEITKFSGYRGTFHIKNQQRYRKEFDWTNELNPEKPLKNNNEMIIYEMPLHWMSSAEEGMSREVGLGTFERVAFERFDHLLKLGINTIQLLPVQDSKDTLNWGYGTRFFFTTDFDYGTPIDFKYLIKKCHQNGIRVIMDVVMNHTPDNPLIQLAEETYFLNNLNQEGRDFGYDYGAKWFRYREPHNARDLQYCMAEYWIKEFHIDGFRIDEFKGINNYEFIQEFRERAWSVHNRNFTDRPFIVIAEDSSRRTEIAEDNTRNPNGKIVVDALWNFNYKDEIRNLIHDELHSENGTAQSERIKNMISNNKVWSEIDKTFHSGNTDLAKSIIYFTSHDVQGNNQRRLLNDTMSRLMENITTNTRERELTVDAITQVKNAVEETSDEFRRVKMLQEAHKLGLMKTKGAFGILMTSVGIPMFLAGEEFGDIHDLDYNNWRLKMSDPVDWDRMKIKGHTKLFNYVSELINLRKNHPALKRDGIEFFHFNQNIDNNDAERVFAYCRTNNTNLGSDNQVIVVANFKNAEYTEYQLHWPWDINRIREVAKGIDSRDVRMLNINTISIPLKPFEVRVFCS
ncbi:MAG: alpha-amylase family glycosyl hydrolase [Bacteroidota bacterium]|nr:alpha-amylase family glycosyl hydrolase [Bacteroidota bacterium]